MKSSTIAALVATMISITALRLEAADPIVNGDFQTGDLSGWTLFTDPFGTLGPAGAQAVVPFDTNGDTFATFSARFQVGRIPNSPLQPPAHGGGMFQTITTDAGARDHRGSRVRAGLG